MEDKDILKYLTVFYLRSMKRNGYEDIYPELSKVSLERFPKDDIIVKEYLDNKNAKEKYKAFRRSVDLLEGFLETRNIKKIKKVLDNP